MARSPPYIQAQPTTAQAGQVMYPWVLAVLSQDLPASDNFSATATLFDVNGQPVSGELDGQRNVSGRRHEDAEHGPMYFLFDTLAIRSPGTWRIHVTVTQFRGGDESGAQSRGAAITQPIRVSTEPVSIEEYRKQPFSSVQTYEELKC